MAIKYKEVPGWTFDVDEVSANVFKVTGSDRSGRRFEKTGVDPDALLQEAKLYAAKIIADLESKPA